MIVVYTGKPGAGKTLYALAELVEFAEKEGGERPIYVSGVRGFNPGHPDIEHLNIQILERPETWSELPEGSIVLIDEAQRIFRPGTSGNRLPTYQTDLETHRHRGFDLIFTTQGPHLLHAHIHPLVDRHVHLHRGNARQGAWRYEWGELMKLPRGKTAQEKAQVTQPVSFPRNVYEWYSSAEIHTHRWRVPWRLLAKASIPLLFLGLAGSCAYQSDIVMSWFGVDRGSDSILAGPAAVVNENVSRARDPEQRNRTGRREEVLSMTWEELNKPEIPGQPWTAPIYRQRAASVSDWPRPQCIEINRNDGRTSECRCYTAQATRMSVMDNLCRHFVAYGFFDPTRPAGGPGALALPDARPARGGQ